MPDEERAERFLRTLLGVLLVAALVAALVSPPNPSTFLLLLVPAWIVGAAVAVVLVYFDGYARLVDSPLFGPGAPLSQATAAFVGLAVVLKVVLTFLADAALGAAAVGYAEGLVTSLFALLVAYGVVFFAGVLGWFERFER